MTDFLEPVTIMGVSVRVALLSRKMSVNREMEHFSDLTVDMGPDVTPKPTACSCLRQEADRGSHVASHFDYVDGQALPSKLTMQSAIAAMGMALADDVENPPRTRLGSCLFMPGRVGKFTGIKVVSTVAGNPAGLVTVYRGDGTLLGMVDGKSLTLLRTGALSGLATRLLAPAPAHRLAILGAGAVAPQQVNAVCAVRPIRHISVWSRTPEKAMGFVESLRQEHPLCEVRYVQDADAAVAQADIVCCATAATKPLFRATSVRSGTHINAVGAYTPQMAEVPAACVHAAQVFVEERGAASREAGDLIQANCVPLGTLGDILEGRLAGRDSPHQTTLFKSVGLASADIAAAVVALLGDNAFAL